MFPRKPRHRHGFQNYALYPHMTVYEPGLRFETQPVSPPRLNVGYMKPRKSSGFRWICFSGARRNFRAAKGKVAVGRAIVRKPKVFL